MRRLRPLFTRIAASLLPRTYSCFSLASPYCADLPSSWDDKKNKRRPSMSLIKSPLKASMTMTSNASRMASAHVPVTNVDTRVALAATSTGQLVLRTMLIGSGVTGQRKQQWHATLAIWQPELRRVSVTMLTRLPTPIPRQASPSAATHAALARGARHALAARCLAIVAPIR